MADSTFIKFNDPVWHDGEFNQKENKKKDFFGRKTEKNAAIEILTSSDSRRPVIIIGERRAGKTSLMKLLIEYLKDDNHFLPIEIPWLGITSFDQFVHEFITLVAINLEVSPSDYREIKTWMTGIDISVAVLMYQIDQLLKKTNNTAKTLVFCIDEFDSIIDEQLTNNEDKTKILGLINTIVESSNLPIKLLLNMTSSPKNIESTRHSPLTAKAEQLYLKPFNFEETKELITTILGNQYELDIQRIYELSGGWPYFIKLLLVYIVKSGLKKPNMNEVLKEALKDHPANQSIENIFLKHFDDYEKAIVLWLAKEKGTLKNEKISNFTNCQRRAIGQLIDRFFLKDNNDDSVSFTIEYFKEWFLQWDKYDLQFEKYLEHSDLSFEGTVIEITEDDLKKFE